MVESDNHIYPGVCRTRADESERVWRTSSEARHDHVEMCKCVEPLYRDLKMSRTLERGQTHGIKSKLSHTE